MFCRNCGKEQHTADDFCCFCGTKVLKTSLKEGFLNSFWLKYGLRFTARAALIVLALATLESVYGDFEKITTSILIVITVTLHGIASSLKKMMAMENIKKTSHFDQLIKHSNEISLAKSSVQTEFETDFRHKIETCTAMAFKYLIYVVAAFTLFEAL